LIEWIDTQYDHNGSFKRHNTSGPIRRRGRYGAQFGNERESRKSARAESFHETNEEDPYEERVIFD
jgi:hypothetical protein